MDEDEDELAAPPPPPGASHMHLTWTCLVLRSSRQWEHWVAGRPFFLISNRGRSVCVQADERWPEERRAKA